MTINDFPGVATLVLGPFVGSFIGLLSLRLPAGRDWVASRSACSACHRPLGVTDLVPLFSYLALRGRCRTCGAAIPVRYPLFEVGCLLIAVWSFATQTGWLIPATALLGWQLLLIAVIDAEHLWLPDLLTLPLGLVGAAVTFALTDAPYWAPLAGAAVGYGVLGLIAWLYKRTRGRDGLGGGDPRLLGAIGAWVGWQGLASVLVWASLAGLSVAAAMLITRRRLAEDKKLPFGTFLAIGAWLTWLWGPLHTLLR